MRGVADTSWLEALPTVGVALLVLFVPGVVAALLLRCRLTVALGVGPGLSVTALSLGGIVAALAGVRWAPATMLATTLVLWGATGLIGLWRRARAEDAGDAADARGLWSVALGGLLGLGGVAMTLVPVSRSADAFPQHPDTVFHLSTTRWMLENGDISSLHASGYASETGTGFYPAAVHGVAATVQQLSGATVVTSMSATVLVVAGLVWPLGLVVLARRVLGERTSVAIAAGLASAAFSAFPYWFLGYGVLWPNLLGQALLPGVLYAVVALVSGPARLNALVLLALGVPGLALAHPNAVVALGLIGGVVAVGALARWTWTLRQTPVRAAAVATATIAMLAMAGAVWAVATRLSTAMRGSNPAGPEMSLRDAFLDVALFAPRSAGYLWVAGVLVVLGVVVVLWRHRAGVWVAVVFVGVAALYILNTAVDSETTRLLTWPWYNNAPRLAALLIVPAALLMTAALSALADGLARLLAGRVPAPALAGTATVALAYLLTSAWGGTAVHQDLLDNFFDEDSQSAFVSDSELRALATLGRQVPRDAVVAANPLNGGSYLYLATGRTVLFPSEKGMVQGDRLLLGKNLNTLASDPAVCSAVRRNGVTHVVTGGEPTTFFGRARREQYAGLAAVPTSPGFELLGAEGPYRLYRVVGCAEG